MLDRSLRMARLEALAARARPLVSAGSPPFLAHTRVRSPAGAERDLLFGEVTRVTAGSALLDWRTAPLAEVLFAAEEGEAYELELEDGRVIEGTLLERNLVAFEAGALRLVDGAAPGLAPRPEAARGRPAGFADVTLDDAQRALVELPAERSVLVLGEAGCGKTTVALHRAAALAARARRAGRSLRAAVVVPNEALATLSRALLDRLGAAEVEVWRFDRLAAGLARRAFPDLPRRESANASAGVQRLKRHPALRAALARLAPLEPALPLEGRPRRRSRALARHDDLHALFGDGALLARVREASGDGLPAHAVAEALEHARLQFSASTEEELGPVLPGALVTSDGRGVDEGTPLEDAGTVDPEDHAVMFELERLRALHRGRAPRAPAAYDLLVVDEAQELAPLELALLGRCVAPGGAVVVAGDADQQVDPAVLFAGWDETLRELGAPEAARARLLVSYRCPPAVTALARGLREGAAGPATAPSAPEVVGPARFPSELHVARWLADALPALRAEDPGTSVAVVCRTEPYARRLARVLGFATGARLALGGRFSFGPGVQVTTVDEVKGLEFDHVVLPDASAATYPATGPARRALYVAVTRARHQLVLGSPGEVSPWLGS